MADNPMEALLALLRAGQGPRGTMFMGRHLAQGDQTPAGEAVLRPMSDVPEEGMGGFGELANRLAPAGIAMGAPKFSAKAPGGVPNSEEIATRGFVREMAPEDFRKAAYPLDEYHQPSIDYPLNRVVQGEQIGQPLLNVRWLPNEGKWGVIGHEGRHRNKMLEDYFPGIKMPIHFFPEGMRASQLTPEMLTAPLINERTMLGKRYATPGRITTGPSARDLSYQVEQASPGKFQVMTAIRDSDGSLMRNPFGKLMPKAEAEKLAKEMNRAIADRMAD